MISRKNTNIQLQKIRRICLSSAEIYEKVEVPTWLTPQMKTMGTNFMKVIERILEIFDPGVQNSGPLS